MPTIETTNVPTNETNNVPTNEKRMCLQMNKTNGLINEKNE